MVGHQVLALAIGVQIPVSEHHYLKVNSEHISNMQKKLVKRKSRPKGMPLWMECTWRRNPCRRNDCPICTGKKTDCQNFVETNANSGDLKIVLEDIGNNFKEVFAIIQADARKKGIDISSIKNIKEPPQPREFPLFIELRKWQKSVFELAENSHASFWTYTENAQDLFWYANTLGTKVYRQLCNKWHVERGEKYGDFDFQYTGYVLDECFKTIKASLARLILIGSADKGKLIFLLAHTMILEKKITKI
jgi:hypothetical protein